MYWTGKSGETLRVRRYHRSKTIESQHIIAVLVTLRIRFRRIPPDAQQHIGRDVAGERRAWYFFHTPIQLTHGRQAPIIPSHATFMRQRYQDDSFQ
jgi:hypothetical protein